MPDEILKIGSTKRLVWGADTSGRLRARDHFNSLKPQDQASFRALFDRMADTGQIQNTQKFRQEASNLFVFKIHKQRLACFMDGKTVVLISGFTKKSDKGRRVAREIRTAVTLRDDYLSRKGAP